MERLLTIALRFSRPTGTSPEQGRSPGVKGEGRGISENQFQEQKRLDKLSSIGYFNKVTFLSEVPEQFDRIEISIFALPDRFRRSARCEDACKSRPKGAKFRSSLSYGGVRLFRREGTLHHSTS